MINPEFLKRIREKRAEIANVPFFILVWGPAIDSGSLVAQKRKNIRDDLAANFGEGNVVFSENPNLQQLHDEVGDYAAEFLEAWAADAVIIIAESIGSIAETALYRRLIAAKALVFVESREQPGFASEAYARLKTEAVAPEEWKSCDRIRRKARYFVETLRIERYESQG
jgi:hypothetical protein